MKEILAREDKLASQNSVLVTLVSGTEEEIKVSGNALLFHDLLASVKRLGSCSLVSDIVGKGFLSCNVCKQ